MGAQLGDTTWRRHIFKSTKTHSDVFMQIHMSMLKIGLGSFLSSQFPFVWFNVVR